MSTPMTSLAAEQPWQRRTLDRHLLPFPQSVDDGPAAVSDAVKLRVASALQCSLHVRDVITTFARESRRLVRGVGVRYRHRAERCEVAEGPGGLHRYSYELKLVGNNLGELTFSHASGLTEADLSVLEVLLCTLIYPLRNALQYERALRIALKDPLTGVNNRASMNDHLNHHVSLARRQNMPLSVLMLDIDHFKSVNDRFGHIVGDIVLTEVARAIVRCGRNSDGVFRYGGEEFVVVLPGTDRDGAELLADRVRVAIAELEVEALPADAAISASIGVAHLAPGEKQSELLTRADEALLAAKRAGRDRVRVAAEPADVAGRDDKA